MKVRHFLPIIAAMATLALGFAGPALAITHADTPVNDDTRDELIGTGTLVKIAMLQTISSAHSKIGDTFQFRVVDNVMAGSRVAIPAGVTGTGKVLAARPSRSGREDGQLRVEFNPLVLADGTEVTLAITHESLVADENIKNGTASAFEDVANMTIPGFFILDFLRKGNEITLGANAPFHIAVTQDAFLSK